MPYEMIVTSVPRGLDGGSGFQAVRRTKGMSLALSERLQQRSGYTHQFAPGDERNPVIYSHRIERVAGELYHVIAAIRDAGTDHSGRSNRLAHLIAFSQAEVQDFPVGPAELLHILRDQNIICKRWSGPPEQTAAPVFPRGNTTPRAPCSAWLKAGVEPAIAGELAEAAGRAAPVQILLKDSVDALALFGDASLLASPSNRWQITFSTDAATAGQLTWTAAVGAQGQSLAASGRFEVIDATVKRQPTPTPFTRFAAGESRELPWQMESTQQRNLASGSMPGPGGSSPTGQPPVDLNDGPKSRPSLPPDAGQVTPPVIGYRKRRSTSPRSTRLGPQRRAADDIQPTRPSKTAWLGVSILLIAAVGCVTVLAIGLSRPDLVYAVLKGTRSVNKTQKIESQTITRRPKLDIEKRKAPQGAGSEQSISSMPEKIASQGKNPDAARRARDEQAEKDKQAKQKDQRDAELQSKLFEGIASSVSFPRQAAVTLDKKPPASVSLGLLNLSGFKVSKGLLDVDLDHPANIDLQVVYQPAIQGDASSVEKWCITTSDPKDIGGHKRTTLLEVLITSRGSEASEISLKPNPRTFSSREFAILQQCLIMISPKQSMLSKAFKSDVPKKEIRLWKPSGAGEISVNPAEIFGEDNADETELVLPRGNDDVNAIAGALNMRLTVRVEADNDGRDKPRDIIVPLTQDLNSGEKPTAEKHRIELFDFGSDGQDEVKAYLLLEVTDEQELRYWTTIEPITPGFKNSLRELRSFNDSSDEQQKRFLQKRVAFISKLEQLFQVDSRPIIDKRINLFRLTTLLDHVAGQKEENLPVLDKALGELCVAARERIREWKEEGGEGERPQEYPADFNHWRESVKKLTDRINEKNDNARPEENIKAWKRGVCRIAKDLEKKVRAIVGEQWYENARRLARISRSIKLTGIAASTTYQSRRGEKVTVELVVPSEQSNDGGGRQGEQRPTKQVLSTN